MPIYLTSTLLDSLTDQTEIFLQKAISEWQMTPPDQFTFKASPSQWSANQCLVHLNSYGRYYLPALERAIAAAGRQGSKPSVQFQAGWLGAYFTRIMLPADNGLPLKKMRAPKEHNPVENKDPHLAIARFIEQQEDMLSLLERARKINLNNIRIPISISRFIRLKLGDTFHFLVAHNYRHALQAERSLKAAGVSKQTPVSLILPETI